MDKLRLIIAREYMSIVGRKSFIIMTILFPFLMIAIGSIPVLMTMLNNSGDQTEQIAVIDETGRYSAALQSDNRYNFVAIKGDTLTNAREFYDKSKGSISAVIVIPRDVETSAQVNIYSESTVAPALTSMVNNALTDTIQNAKLAAKGIPDLQKIVEETSIDLDVRTVTWQQDGNETESSSDIAMGLGMILAMVIYIFVMMCGSMIMNNVIEEKTNRIVEVVVSSCRPFHLMLGKIIGVGLSGLTQMAIWIVLLAIAGSVMGNVLGGLAASPEAIAPGMDASEVNNVATDFMQQIMSINYTPIIINFLLYFIGGYLLYSAIFAALGSAVDQASDTSQFLWPVMMLMIIALYAAIGCAENPNGPMAFWCSMIPFTSPIVMMIRLPYDVPLWQMFLSHALLLGTALAIVWCAARIYRRGILHYGQKASFNDLFKWIK
ncbi:MAG: ABC transporter permease [Muribaculaceae bacterium]|nr:ABC transporter permease [Muribaculaceae bacterium]